MSKRDPGVLARHKDLLQAQASAAVRMLLVNSQPGGREALARAMGVGLEAPDRNVAVECGYPAVIDIGNFRRLYDRHGLAQRAVDCLPNECWKHHPLMYETERQRTTGFERDWKSLCRRIPMWSVLHRADRLAGLGRYGVVYLGFDDLGNGRTPAAPVDETRKNKLLFAQVYTEDLAEIVALDESDSSERAGLPVKYRLTVGETRSPAGDVLMKGRTVEVHWTRVVHLADGIDTSPVYGRERMRAVYDYLLDLRKVLGGSAEMFWKGAFPGFSLEMLPEYIGNPLDDETIKAEMDAYHNHLQRYIALEGFKVNPLAPGISDPTPHVTQLINAICATLEMPVRLFMGSESGHLASTQDSGNWNGRVTGRRSLYVEPFVIRPTVDRLIRYGVLAAPRNPDKDYIITWPDLNSVSEKDRADIALKAAQTLMQYATSGAEKVYPFALFLTNVMRHTEEEAAAVLAALKDNPLYTKELWEQLQPAKPAGSAGRPAGSPTTAA